MASLATCTRSTAADTPRPDADTERRPEEPARVVLVSGAGRSGSTLLTMMLGALPGAFAVGELRYLWERGLVEHRLCGCGRPVPECPVWRAILTRAFGSIDDIDVEVTIEAVNWLGDAAHLPAILRKGRRRRLPELGDLPDRLRTLYQAIRDETGAEFIVDSSKPPTYGWLVGSLPGVEVSVVHLVRDPRGSAFSWSRPKRATDRPEGGLMPRKAPWKSAINWEVWNAATELLFRSRADRVLRVRYEDLLGDPAAVLGSVLDFLGQPRASAPPLDGGRFTPPVSHTVAGNPSRLTTEPTTLDVDVGWLTGMSSAPRRVVTALTAPLLHHYGYRVLRRHAARELTHPDDRAARRRSSTHHVGRGTRHV